MSPTTVALNVSKPAWQTADLDEEWIDDALHDGPGDDNDTASVLTRSFVVHGSSVPEDVDSSRHSHVHQLSSPIRGTFQIREDQPAAPIGQLLEKKNQSRNAFKDFFTPLALETMFNPPSPNQSQSKTTSSTTLKSSHSATSTACAEEDNMEITGNLSNHSIVMDDEEQGDVILASDIPNLVAFDGRKPSTDYQFTFSAVQPGSTESNTPLPVSQATAPTTDPRLRLFQFQYDTFTREHLSAVVDSIAVHASDSSKSASPQLHSLHPPCQAHLCSDLRAPKRLKLTPPEGVSTNQPPGHLKARKDYVGESKSFMQKIKDARSPSMMTIFADRKNSPERLDNTNRDWKEKEDQIEPYSFWSTDSCSATTPSSTKLSYNSALPSSGFQPSTAQHTFSSLVVYPTSSVTSSMPLSLDASTLDPHPRSSTYRQQAADLMAQIRKDMTKGKRIFSSGTHDEVSFLSKSVDKEPSVQVSITPASPDNTTNVKQPSSPHDFASLSEKQRKPIKPSPRKLLRRLSAADEVDREIALNKTASETSLVVELSALPSTTDDKITHLTLDSSRLQTSLQPQIAENHDAAMSHSKFLVPPSNDMVPNESNRKVSGGTTTSVETADSVLTRATTATSSTSLFTARSVSAGSADSAASFVKHAGPAQITRITPDDLPLPELIGGMRFDRTLMRWVKAQPKKAVVEEGALTIVSEESDDPFRDIESIHSGKLDETVEHLQKVEESDAETDDHQGNEATVAATVVKVLSVDSDTDDSFDFDYGPEVIVEIMTGEESHDTAFESVDYQADDLQSDIDPLGSNSEVEEEDTILADSQRCSKMEPSSVVVATLPQPNTPTPAHRSNIPPRSVLKNGTGSNKSTPQLVTPHTSFLRGHRRSVSFSDGRKDGKIQELGWYKPEDDEAPGPHPMFSTEVLASITPSVRGKRIAAILDDLANLNLDEELSNTQKASNNNVLASLESRPAVKNLSNKMKGAEAPINEQANRTYLTECSFGISHDKLVHIITDIHPYVPHWEKVKEIDLTGKGIESVARLKELLPHLDKIHLDHNRLSWLTGLPNSMRTLSISSNLLTSLASFNQLTNLECLDISNNGIESLKQLSPLRHLRELRADGNTITSLEGLEDLDGLIKLSLKGNKITHVNFEEVRWPRLEVLNISRNELRSITGLSSLSSLSVLNLDHNQLICLESERTMPRLHTLRISNNHISQLESGRFCNLRILYADNNRLAKVHRLERLRKLESLSLRNQGGQLALSMRDIRDVKRLYLSGNSLSPSFLQEPCYNLIYLELAGCRLTSLPCNLSRLIPNIRVLNLNYNFLTDTRALDGLTRLRKLTLIGSRLKGTKSLVRILRRMPEIEMLDFRMNPCTLGWYLPILVQDIPGMLQPSEDQPHSGDDTNDGSRAGAQKRNSSHKKHGIATAPPVGRSHAQSWQELDAKFRGDLPDEAYVGRLAYRGLVMRACPKIKMLDGVLISAGEKEKAERLLRDVLAAKRKPDV